MKKTRILIADDDYIFSELTKFILTENRFNVSLTNSSQATIDFFEHDTCDLILLDLYFPSYQTGLKTLKSLKDITNDIPIIIITSENISLMNRFSDLVQNGARDIIEKPIQVERLLLTINNALTYTSIVNSNKNKSNESIYLIGNSLSINTVKSKMQDELQTNNHLMIYADSGTGVESIVKKIHQNSIMQTNPLRIIDCSKLSFKEMKIALLGDHDELEPEKRFQNLDIVQAQDSALLISNIHLMPLKLQEKFVRTLSGRRLNSLGGKSLADINVKLIFTTNRKNYNNLNSTNISPLLLNICLNHLIIPTLNERIEDIPKIIDYLIANYNQTTDSNVSIDNSALKVLMRHKWIDNLDELKKVFFKTLHQLDSDKITSKDISFHEDVFTSFVPLPYKQAIKSFEKRYLEQVMEYKEWNLTDAALVLNIDRSNLFKKLQKHGIKPK